MNSHLKPEMIKVVFLVPYPIDCAPSQRLKFEQYFPYFRENGIQIIFAPFMSRGFYHLMRYRGRFMRKALLTAWGYFKRLWHLWLCLKADVVYLHLESAPFGPPIIELILNRFKIPFIYDIDDLVYMAPPQGAGRLMNFLRNRGKVRQIMRLSAHIIVCTEYLRKFALGFNNKVTNISSTIDTDKYKVKEQGPAKQNITIGWSGSTTTSFYLHLLDNALKALQDKFHVDIKVIGDPHFSIPGVKVKSCPWVASTEVDDLREIDIGLYPLSKDTWVLGKSGLKALQYMGLGIPVVAQAIGTNLEIIRDGVNGFLADSPDEWLEKISLLIREDRLRSSMGSAARRTVEERYSVKVNAPIYLDIIRSVYSAYRCGRKA